MSVFWRSSAAWAFEPADPPGERPTPDEILAVLEWLVAQRRLGPCAVLPGVCARPAPRALTLVLHRLEVHLRQAVRGPGAADAPMAPLFADLARLRFAAHDSDADAPLAVYTRRAAVAMQGVARSVGPARWV